MNILGLLILLFALVLGLWLAYRVGQVVLRILAGLLFLALMSLSIWYLFLK